MVNGFKIYRIWNLNAWATSFASQFGGKSIQVPEQITWSSPSLLFILQSSRLWIPPPFSFFFPVVMAFVQTLLFPYLDNATAFQLSACGLPP